MELFRSKEDLETKFSAPQGYVHPAHRKRIAKSFDNLARPYDYGTNRAMEEVVKALATSPLSGFGDATPLRLENLDMTMTAVLFQEDHLKLMNAIPRVPAKQIVFQWIRRISYGTQRSNRGFAEGGIPQSGVSSWRRGTGNVKYYGVKRGYTHQMVMVGQAGGAYIDPVADENRAGTMELLGGLERDILFSVQAIGSNSNSCVNYDGLINQLNASSQATYNVIDKKGAPIDFEDLENWGEQFVRRGKLFNFNNLRTFWAPRTLSDLAKLKVQAERKLLNDATPGFRPGTPLEGYRTQHGYVPFEESIFLDRVEDGGVAIDDTGTQVADAGAPAAPTITSAVPATSGGAMPDGSYYYFVSSLNDSGESLTTTSSVATITGGGGAGQVTVTIAATSGATGYRIYRGTTNVPTASTTKWVADVWANYPTLSGATGFQTGTAGSGAVWVDVNAIIPGTYQAVLMNAAEPDMAMAQLAPLIKFPLAVVTTTQGFALILYHVPILKAPERMLWVKNIGVRP